MPAIQFESHPLSGLQSAPLVPAGHADVRTRASVLAFALATSFDAHAVQTSLGWVLSRSFGQPGRARNAADEMAVSCPLGAVGQALSVCSPGDDPQEIELIGPRHARAATLCRVSPGLWRLVSLRLRKLRELSEREVLEVGVIRDEQGWFRIPGQHDQTHYASARQALLAWLGGLGQMGALSCGDPWIWKADLEPVG